MHSGSQIEQIHLCREPIDFRKSIDGLSVLVEQALELNPFSSVLYVFTHRQRNKIKALYCLDSGVCFNCWASPTDGCGHENLKAPMESVRACVKTLWQRLAPVRDFGQGFEFIKGIHPL